MKAVAAHTELVLRVTLRRDVDVEQRKVNSLGQTGVDIEMEEEKECSWRRRSN